MPHRRTLRFVWRNLAVFVLIGATVVDTALFVQALDQSHKSSRLTAQNQERINDIQRARVESCEHTYEGVRQVFKPFFRTKTVRTVKEQRNIEKFNARIDELKAGCPLQTGVN